MNDSKHKTLEQFRGHVYIGNFEQVRSMYTENPWLIEAAQTHKLQLVREAIYWFSFTSLKVARYLLDNGADVNETSKDSKHDTALERAVSSRQMEVCELLLEYKVSDAEIARAHKNIQAQMDSDSLKAYLKNQTASRRKTRANAAQQVSRGCHVGQ